jgi:hypothetical protein
MTESVKARSTSKKRTWMRLNLRERTDLASLSLDYLLPAAPHAQLPLRFGY